MKLAQAILIVLLVGACGGEPANVTIEAPTPPAPIVVDGGIICKTTVSSHKVFDKTDRCPAADLVLTGHADGGVECASLQTECWVKKDDVTGRDPGAKPAYGLSDKIHEMFNSLDEARKATQEQE